MSCVELVSRLSLSLAVRGTWAMMVTPSHQLDAVVDELSEAWAFGPLPIHPELVTLESDARPLLSRCDATAPTVFIVRILAITDLITAQLESERSRWLLSRGGVFVAEEDVARTLLHASPNTASVLGSNVVRWARDPGLEDT